MKHFTYDSTFSHEHLKSFQDISNYKITNIIFINNHRISNSFTDFGHSTNNRHFHKITGDGRVRFVLRNAESLDYYIFDFKIEKPVETIFGVIHIFNILQFEPVTVNNQMLNFDDIFYSGEKVDNSMNCELNFTISKIEIYGARKKGVREETSFSSEAVTFDVSIDSLIVLYSNCKTALVVKGQQRKSGVEIDIVEAANVDTYLQERIYEAENDWGDKYYTLITSIN